MHIEYIITGFTLVNGGSNYTTPHVSITGGGGFGATATARVSQGVIYDVVLTNAGSGYTSIPTVSFIDPDPRAGGAEATVTATSVEVEDFDWTPILILAGAVVLFGVVVTLYSN